MTRSHVGRRIILFLILLGFILSFVVLWWVGSGDAISPETNSSAIKLLVGHYLPLLAILGGFYFSERSVVDQGGNTSIETVTFALIIVGLWVLGPPMLIAVNSTIEGAMRLIDSGAVIGTSLVSACLAFYFSKSAKVS
ncbi:hypothetical protein ACMGG8_22910 [Pseudomonas sp. BNK-45]|uniref:hypothetical protein n=1 Tax=Pseudomonas sp. BNK-45 TaxID=3376180 RepID=UPI0039BEFC85